MGKATISKTTRASVLDRDNWQCQYCGEALTDSTSTLDHLVPHSEGGTGRADNLLACCRACNIQRGAKPLDEWRFAMTLRTAGYGGVISPATAKTLQSMGVDLKLPPPVRFYFERQA